MTKSKHISALKYIHQYGIKMLPYNAHRLSSCSSRPPPTARGKYTSTTSAQSAEAPSAGAAPSSLVGSKSAGSWLTTMDTASSPSCTRGSKKTSFGLNMGHIWFHTKCNIEAQSFLRQTFAVPALHRQNNELDTKIAYLSADLAIILN